MFHKSGAVAEENSGGRAGGGRWKIGCKPGRLEKLSQAAVRGRVPDAANRAKIRQLYKIFGFPQPFPGLPIGGLCGKRARAAGGANGG